MIIDLARLDAALAAEVVGRFDHRNINVDVPEFAEGRLVPTGENLARFIHQRLQAALDIRVVSVTVEEDDSLSSTYPGD